MPQHNAPCNYVKSVGMLTSARMATIVSLVRAWSIPAIKPMLTSRPYPLYVVRQHARRPPFRLVRGSVGDQSADVRARGAFERACRTATATSCFARGGALTGCCCCASLRPGAPPRALSSQLYLEALGCSQRVLGFLLLSISSSWTTRSSSLRWPCFNQSPAHATVKQSCPRSRRSLVQRR